MYILFGNGSDNKDLVIGHEDEEISQEIEASKDEEELDVEEASDGEEALE